MCAPAALQADSDSAPLRLVNGRSYGKISPQMSGSICEHADAWRELLSWATPEERRTLLDSEHLAALYFGELARRGLGGLRQVEAFEHAAALEALAVALAAHHDHPMRLMDGASLPPRS